MASLLLSIILLYAVSLIRDTTGSSNDPYDTIVVGIGASGATAASTLARAGRRVLVLEAQDRVGGRVKTVPFGDGVVEEGAEWIHGTYFSRVYDLAVQNNVSLVDDVKEELIYRADGKAFNESLVKDLTVFCLDGYETNLPKKHESAGHYVTRRCMQYLKTKYPEEAEDTRFVKEFFMLLESIFCSFYACNSWNEVPAKSSYADLEGNQLTSWHRHGYKTFFEIILNTYNKGPGLPNLDIKLNKEVTLIKWPRDSTGPVQVTCRDGDHYTASNVIVTVSLGVLKERYSTLFEPELPNEKIAAIDIIPIGVLGKIILSFPEKWWKQTNPILLFGMKYESSEWLYSVDGVSNPTGSDNTLTMWLHGDVLKIVENLPVDVVKKEAMELLRQFMGKNYTIPEPNGIIRSTWLSNPYTRGAYSYDSLDMEQFPGARTTLFEPLVDEAGSPKVLFAGEATNSVHFGTVHGASNTGYREAMRLLPSNKVWTQFS